MNGTVTVSGLGVVTALGVGRAALANAFVGDRAALTTTGTGDGLDGTVAGRVDGPGGPGGRPRRGELLTRAWHDAGAPQAAARGLVVLVGQAPGTEEPARHPGGLGHPSVHDDLAEIRSGLPLTALATRFGEILWVSHACASMLFALDVGRAALLDGAADVAVVAGATTLTRMELLGMQSTRALSPTGARPFDVDRDGTSIGEGAAVIVVERTETVRRRGEPGLAVVAGLDCQVAAPASASASDPDVQATCIDAALVQAAAVDARPVRYVQAHATGTVHGDEAELSALGAVASDRRWDEVLVASHKGGTGHLMHASAGPALVAAVLALQRELGAGTPGLRRTAEWPERLRPVPVTAPVRSGPVLIDSFGFGGNTASLVLTHPRDTVSAPMTTGAASWPRTTSSHPPRRAARTSAWPPTQAPPTP